MAAARRQLSLGCACMPSHWGKGVCCHHVQPRQPCCCCLTPFHARASFFFFLAPLFDLYFTLLQARQKIFQRSDRMGQACAVVRGMCSPKCCGCSCSASCRGRFLNNTATRGTCRYEGQRWENNNRVSLPSSRCSLVVGIPLRHIGVLKLMF